VLTVIFPPPVQEGSSPKAPRFAPGVAQMLLVVHSTGVEMVNGSALGYFMPYALTVCTQCLEALFLRPGDRDFSCNLCNLCY
jgi:hypothetical protein